MPSGIVNQIYGEFDAKLVEIFGIFATYKKRGMESYAGMILRRFMGFNSVEMRKNMVNYVETEIKKYEALRDKSKTNVDALAINFQRSKSKIESLSPENPEYSKERQTLLGIEKELKNEKRNLDLSRENIVLLKKKAELWNKTLEILYRERNSPI